MIAGPQRSGTTAVHLLLAGHSRVSVFMGELNSRVFIEGLSRFAVHGYLTEQEKRRGHRELFDALTRAGAERSAPLRGVKTCMSNPRTVQSMGRVLRERLPGTRVIVTCRGDYVAHLGSRLHLHRTGVAHSWHQRPGDRPERIRIPKTLLAWHVVNMERLYAAYRNIVPRQALFWLEYEAFARDNRAIYERLLAFLDLPFEEPVWAHSRKVLPAPRDYIHDYDELTRYARRIAQAHHEGRLSPAFVRLVGLGARLHRMLKRRREKRTRRSRT